MRVLGTGGRELTDAIATDLDLPPETAEALKRQLGGTGHDELVGRARTAIERPLSVLLDEVRSSIDYYRNQPGSSSLIRIVVTGGGAQLPGLTERLSALVGVPVEPARPRELIALGDIGFTEEELPRLDPYLPAAVGLALGGAGVGTVINLLPSAKRSTVSKPRPQVAPGAIAAAAALVVVLGGFTYPGHQKRVEREVATREDRGRRRPRCRRGSPRCSPCSTGSRSSTRCRPTSRRCCRPTSRGRR